MPENSQQIVVTAKQMTDIVNRLIEEARTGRPVSHATIKDDEGPIFGLFLVVAPNVRDVTNALDAMTLEEPEYDDNQELCSRG